ncbi:YbgA family protein [Thiogranum longum]
MKEPMQKSELGTLRMGVSACLLGARVRFDGGHKQNRFILDMLGQHFEFVPFCPEVAIGLGTPRDTIRLVGREDSPRAVGSRNPDLDVTDALRDYSRKTAQELDGLCGFILKKDSPSCGMERVRIYNDKSMPHRNGVGLFAREVIKANPLLPVEEEGRLNDPALRENFINRVFVYARWRALRQQGLTKAGLIAFHARHKLTLMAHSPQGYRELGPMLARLDDVSLEELGDQYISRLMELLKTHASRKRHVNVLQHLLGYLRKCVDSSARADLVDVIDAYRRGDYPLVVPVTLLQHHFRRNPHPYVSQQVYLNPHPRELMLRNAL